MFLKVLKIVALIQADYEISYYYKTVYIKFLNFYFIFEHLKHLLSLISFTIFQHLEHFVPFAFFTLTDISPFSFETF